MPLSYGTFSHLCASVVHESASARPRTRSRYFGETAAHRPKAPSTCSHAPLRRVSSPISTRGSHAPVFTFPACAHTIVGPDVADSAHSRASGRIRPCVSVATPTIVRLPNPIMRLAAPIDECASSPAMSVTRGAPCSPIASTSHLARRSISCRAAASAVMLAAWAPVTNPTLDSAGRPSASRIQRAVHGLES